MSAETTFSGIMFIIAIIVCFIIFTRRCKKEAEEESAEMHLNFCSSWKMKKNGCHFFKNNCRMLLRHF